MKRTFLFLFTVFFVFTTTVVNAQTVRKPVYYGLTEHEAINVFSRMGYGLEFWKRGEGEVFYTFKLKKPPYEEATLRLFTDVGQGKYKKYLYMSLVISYSVGTKLPLKPFNEWNSGNFEIKAVSLGKKFVILDYINLDGVTEDHIEKEVNLYIYLIQHKVAPFFLFKF